MKNTIIVTGGAGFIGSNFVRLLLKNGHDDILILDKLTYAGHEATIQDCIDTKKVRLVKSDIADPSALQVLFEEHQPQAVFNFAAETHVDRSIDGPRAFIETNIVGVFELCEASRNYLLGLSEEEKKKFRFVHISTDEVYGSLGPTGAFSESTPYEPNSPYSASKAAADHLVHSYFKTYHLPALITNCSNNYGPYQFPEKLIPLMILNGLEGKPLPIYGKGANVRDWIYVEDHCEGIYQVYTAGKIGESYNIGAEEEHPNIEIVEKICHLLEELVPPSSNPELMSKNVKHYADLKKFVTDRPGHDLRYAIDCGKIKKELNWRPAHTFDEALKKTVEWYRDHKEWCHAVQSGRYQRERLGLAGQ